MVLEHEEVFALYCDCSLACFYLVACVRKVGLHLLHLISLHVAPEKALLGLDQLIQLFYITPLIVEEWQTSILDELAGK